MTRIKKNTQKQYELFAKAKRKLEAKFPEASAMTKEQRLDFVEKFHKLHARYFDPSKVELI